MPTLLQSVGITDEKLAGVVEAAVERAIKRLRSSHASVSGFNQERWQRLSCQAGLKMQPVVLTEQCALSASCEAFKWDDRAEAAQADR